MTIAARPRTRFGRGSAGRNRAWWFLQLRPARQPRSPEHHEAAARMAAPRSRRRRRAHDEPADSEHVLCAALDGARSRSMVWSKPDSTWAWKLTPLPGDRTRLVTRIKQQYHANAAATLTVVLCEFGDFAMMRKMLLGIKARRRVRVPRAHDNRRTKPATITPTVHNPANGTRRMRPTTPARISNAGDHERDRMVEPHRTRATRASTTTPAARERGGVRRRSGATGEPARRATLRERPPAPPEHSEPPAPERAARARWARPVAAERRPPTRCRRARATRSVHLRTGASRVRRHRRD